MMREQKEILVGKCMDRLCSLLPEEMPAVGVCRELFVWFIFPGRDYRAHLCVRCDAADPKFRRLVTRIVRPDSDLCIMNYMEKGTMDEILAYLADKSHVPELLESLQNLSDSMDDRD